LKKSGIAWQEFALLGHEVIHIGKSCAELPEKESKSGVKYVRIKGYDTPSSILKLKWLDLLYSIRALRNIKSDADIIVTNTFWAPVLLRGKIGKKVYVDVQRVPKGQMKFYKHVGMLRACSPAIYEAIIKEMPPAFQKLVSYVPNPVPFNVRELGLKRSKVLLFVGRLHPEKGVDELIKAFALLNSQHTKEWKLVIVGPHGVKDGGGGDIYYSKLKELASGLNIDFAGSIFDDNSLVEYYATASIFCYPAQEGSGDAAPVAPREAMAYGCVPIVSELSCFNDFIQNGINGVTYNHMASNQSETLAKVIDLLMSDDTALSRLSEEGKKVAARYSAQVVAREFIEDFNKI
jgi:glycosyltransferase involved in cell wall biosynthesis